ncbi:polysaccharide biosynthesis/export family protein [Ruegeria sp. R13_0]|uniref:polysaccharide biosynthesis/export family protein n=1 Tax=Ruegeria sp. R13_0 TaxID=2821099 RepID=UPI001ADC7ACC|nr:polysaccharide biosynthesis/export family protein [Ruegeria sp. R13_0]MBO9436745.1 polysaccharide biosynthesis/export family protein [Ruegeria sp. R13_0]
MKVVLTLFGATIVGFLTALPALAQGYRVQSGDRLQIEVLEDESLNRDVLVRPDGRITMPLAGTLAASNRTTEQIEGDLSRMLSPNFASPPTVFVSLSSIAEEDEVEPIDVYVVGEAASPGRYEVEPGTTLLQLFAEMGGFSRFAATKRVMLRRTDRAGNEAVYKFNYDAILEGAGNGAATRLVDGDVIIIPQRRLFE